MQPDTPNTPASDACWTVDDATALYRVPAWGQGYFGINDRGHVVVYPDTSERHCIDLHEVVEGLHARDITAPLIVRFPEILDHRLAQLHGAFADAIAANDYRGRYLAVFPIKVNQQRAVVDEVWRFGERFGFGLEAGSKPELLAVMAITEGSDERPIICNGFKDASYIEAVMLATRLGRRIIPVVENFDELGLIIEAARRHASNPRIGVRVKLAAEGSGHWQSSSGARSKFGLSTAQIVELYDTLEREGMAHCLELVHCHPGSQLHDIRTVKQTISELAHVYAQLCALGAKLRYIDVGGGLGVDYDGSGSNLPSSMNYSVEEYASDLVYRIATVCDAHDLEHPTIISESGRAIAAYSSVLVFNVLGTRTLDEQRPDEAEVDAVRDAAAPPGPLLDLVNTWRADIEANPLEAYHDAVQAFEQTQQGFAAGFITLRERALAERLFWSTCVRVREADSDGSPASAQLQGLRTLLADIYFCNLSVFQSLPDAWAIDQLFPIMPLHALQRQPQRDAVLADITCDSDGRIDRFVDGATAAPTVPLHPFEPGTRYYLGAFLVGAYQETLGDLHNLFGDTHVVHVRSDGPAGWRIEEVVAGDSAAELLAYMQFDVEQLGARIARDCERAVRDGRVALAESQAIRRFYERELRGYSYLEPGL